MPITITWGEIALRLLLTLVAGALIGFNREEHGHPVGLRTTILVCLAASIAMIEVNLLLDTRSRPSDSFIMMDLMRLPLGILSGMGFIGAGAIIRKGDRVLGITTAATLWFVTVIGLCFGGGQLGLGAAALLLGLGVLWCLKWVEAHSRRELRAILLLSAEAHGPSEEALRAVLLAERYEIKSCETSYEDQGKLRSLRCEVHWHGRPSNITTPAFLAQIAQTAGVLKVHWKPAVTA